MKNKVSSNTQVLQNTGDAPHFVPGAELSGQAHTFVSVWAGKGHSRQRGRVRMVQRDRAASGSQTAGHGEWPSGDYLQSTHRGTRHPRKNKRRVAAGPWLSPLFALVRNKVPAAREALKKGGRKARQGKPVATWERKRPGILRAGCAPVEVIT